MKTDNTLRNDAMNLLMREFGEVNTERFLYLIKRDDFDYTNWQSDLWNDMSIDEVFMLATEREKARKKPRNDSHTPIGQTML